MFSRLLFFIIIIFLALKLLLPTSL
uniref:Uncharacterized protein n=1 Tax=Rhizophora mucronata TaxID=61149 RepID=A0A2P2QGE8_RHIMU